MGWGVVTSMILEYETDGVGCGNVNDILSTSQMGWGVVTSMILEYVTDGVGCGNVNDT